MKCPKCDFENPEETRFCGNCAEPLRSSEETAVPQTETYQAPQDELTTGSTFAGRYQVIEELGKGGMGKVYKVLDKEIKEKVALKLLKPEIGSDEKIVERFRNELKSARKISHRNVCRMYDLSKEKETHYITMEYVSGEDLNSLISRIGKLTVGKAVLIAIQVGEGLAEAHRLGVVHRDLKPRNIMIDREGNARIMDFGIAQSFKAEGITDTGLLVGTPKYMSPEQVEGQKIDQRSDIYSFGIILYEMVTGQVPFEGETPLTIALKQKSKAPKDPVELNAQVPPELSRVILKCLAKNKEKRYQKIEELLSELSEIEEEITTTDRILPRRKIEPEALRKRFRTFMIPAILLFVAIFLIAGYFLFVRNILKEKPEAVPISGITWKNSIAVLPFEDLSLQKDQEPFCTGMTEAIITKLSSVDELKVIPYRTVSRYKDTEKSLKEIGKELNVTTILVPHLKKEGNRIRVSAQLTNVRENFVIESYIFEEELNSVFEVEDNISKSIAKALEVRLVEERFEDIKKREPKNIDAYENYMKGIHYERKYRKSDKQEDFEAAVKNYEKAIKLDPNYALAFFGLGNVYEAYYVHMGKKEDLESMLNNYMQAYKINPELAEANVGLGWAYFHKEDMDKAYQFFKKAFEIKPNNAEINHNLGGFLRSVGLYRKAIEFYSRAIALDPIPIIYRRLCASCYSFIGEYDESLNVLEEGLELEPDNVGLRLFYARQFIWMKKYSEAEEEITRAEKISPSHPDIEYTRAMIFAARGEKEKALPIISGINPYYFSYLISSVYSALGMKDKAIENINEVIEKGFYEIYTYSYGYPFLINNHFFDSMRDDPEFKEIVKKQKKVHEERMKKYGDL
jgi:serine/threonine protein kinase/Tfp pilus assembly protein PilF